MPSDWRTRAIEYNGQGCPGVTALVPHQDDIALAKLVAWRDKDRDWLAVGIRYRILSLQAMLDRLDRMPSEDDMAGVPAIAELVRRNREPGRYVQGDDHEDLP